MLPKLENALFEADRILSTDAELLHRVLRSTEKIFVKKLANNDRDWAVNKSKHQGGIYIHSEHRDNGIFPTLVTKLRENPSAKEIHEAYFDIVWPQDSYQPKKARLVHYTSKGAETHLTGVPLELFRYLSPASYFVLTVDKRRSEPSFLAMTIDSNSDDAGILTDALDLGPDFTVGTFKVAEHLTKKIDRVLDFADLVTKAWLEGNIDTFIQANAAMPSTFELAQLAHKAFLEKYSLSRTNPFELIAPGDSLREISRDIEWRMFREFQMRERSVELVRIVLGNRPKALKTKNVIRLLIEKFSDIDALMVSAGNQRKSRAGYSYEHHIESMLLGGNIPFEKQVIIEAKKRPDFVLPNFSYLKAAKPNGSTGLILSAKTTLRERWKQVEREKGSRELYLTTVDESIASNAIEEMASMGIRLVVPETLIRPEKSGKKNKYTEYMGHKNVMSFRTFCDEVVKPRMGNWQNK